MGKYEIGDRVESKDKLLIIIDYDITKDYQNIYLCSDKIWYDEKVLEMFIDKPEDETMSDFLGWIKSENERQKKEDRPTIYNFFNLFKKDKPGKLDGLF